MRTYIILYHIATKTLFQISLYLPHMMVSETILSAPR